MDSAWPASWPGSRRCRPSYAAQAKEHSRFCFASLSDEVGRVTAAGAQLLTTSPFEEHDWCWQVLADPDGNEFCILQPPDDFPWPNR